MKRRKIVSIFAALALAVGSSALLTGCAGKSYWYKAVEQPDGTVSYELVGEIVSAVEGTASTTTESTASTAETQRLLPKHRKRLLPKHRKRLLPKHRKRLLPKHRKNLPRQKHRQRVLTRQMATPWRSSSLRSRRIGTAVHFI